ncbi:hypothetical protein, conserved, partial [Eimeria tenella]
MRCSIQCCRLRCRHIVTWHAGKSRLLLVWAAAAVAPAAAVTPAAAAAAAAGGGAHACTRLLYTLRGHERPLLRVRQQTDWRDMHEYFIASLDAGGTVRVWHSAAFPPKETAAAAAAAAAARATESDPDIAAAWQQRLQELEIQQQQQQLRRQQQQQQYQGGLWGEVQLSSRASSVAEEAEDAAADAAAVGCIAIIPSMDSYWIHRISLSSHGLLTLCRPTQQLPQQQQQQLLLLWALHAPSISSMRAKRHRTPQQQQLLLQQREQCSNDPHALWKQMLSSWQRSSKYSEPCSFMRK